MHLLFTEVTSELEILLGNDQAWLVD